MKEGRRQEIDIRTDLVRGEADKGLVNGIDATRNVKLSDVAIGQCHKRIRVGTTHSLPIVRHWGMACIVRELYWLKKIIQTVLTNQMNIGRVMICQSSTLLLRKIDRP